MSSKFGYPTGYHHVRHIIDGTRGFQPMADKKATATTSKRAALRAQQEAQESAKKRRRIIGVTAGVVIIAMVVVAVVFGLNHKSDDVPTTGQITPPSATKDGVYTLNPDKVKAGAPTVTVFQDYQCPACKGAEDALGKPLNELSAEGKIKLEYHTLTFLDSNLHNDSSTRAAMAAAAADVVGKYEPTTTSSTATSLRTRARVTPMSNCAKNSPPKPALPEVTSPSSSASTTTSRLNSLSRTATTRGCRNCKSPVIPVLPPSSSTESRGTVGRISCNPFLPPMNCSKPLRRPTDIGALIFHNPS
ncbi:hypothetical protein JCM18920_1755 [Cutibacterium acnes JCM 18920]|nr:hypothetical protein JCM18920_1755 [Cutibacterium acnes JCM 18920]